MTNQRHRRKGLIVACWMTCNVGCCETVAKSRQITGLPLLGVLTTRMPTPSNLDTPRVLLLLLRPTTALVLSVFMYDDDEVDSR